MNDEPKHFEVRASDDLHATDWVSDFRVMIRGFDGVFLAEAKLAAERTDAAFARRDAPGVAGGTAAAVLLAVAACEARLSEFVTEHERELGATTEAIQGPLRGQALDQWRELLKAKAPAFRPGESTDYLALGCLFKLRDLVAHRNARFMRLGEWPEELADCVRQHAIPVSRSNEIDWTSGTYVHRVAVWAHQTAANWLTTATSLGIPGIESVEPGEIE
jgi:hypothetical protein